MGLILVVIALPVLSSGVDTRDAVPADDASAKAHMLKTLLVITIVCAVPAAVCAKSFPLGGTTPVASITLPDTWDVEPADGGLEALSPDNGIYLSGEIVASEDLKVAGQETARTLAEQKIALKPATQKAVPLTVGGMPGAAIAWDATDENGPTQVHMVVLKAKPGEEVVLLRWGTASAETAHAAEIDAIVKSLAPIK